MLAGSASGGHSSKRPLASLIAIAREEMVALTVANCVDGSHAAFIQR